MIYTKLNLQMFNNTQTTLLNTTGNDLSPEMKTFYDKQLIRTAQANLVHDQFGMKRPIPKGGGKTIEFRKYDPFKKAGTLTEGVTPDGHKLNVSTITATVAQYGDYVEISDMLDLTAIDNNLVEATTLCGDQAGETLDSVTRDVITAGTNVIIAPAVTGGTETAISARSSITAASTLRPKEIRKAAAKLKRVNAKPFDGGYYVGIVHPDAECDLIGDSEWIEAHKYCRPEEMYKGEIGQIAGVRFVRSSLAKIFGPKEIGSGYSRLTVKTAISSSSTSVVVNEVLESVSGVSIPVYIDGNANVVTAITKGSGQSTLTIQTAISSLSVGDIVCGQGGGADGSAVYATLILGKNAYGVTEVSGGGLQHIVKQLGSAGSADPLNQRATSGWKATKTAERLTEAYMVRIEHSSAEFGSIAQAN